MSLDPSTIVKLQHKLDQLKKEHQTLDQQIRQMGQEAQVDLFKIHRLKREKLALKDQIKKVEALFVPNIIA